MQGHERMGVNVTQMPPAGPFCGVAIPGRRRVRMRREHYGFLTKVKEVAPRAGTLGLALLGIIALSGCHTSWPFDGPAAHVDSALFMTTWRTYLHCRSSMAPEEIRADLQQLNRVAYAVSAKNHSSVFLLPAPIRTLISTLPSRLAVDPQAMSTACALHGSHVAQTAGRPELSVEWLTEVVAAHEGWASRHHAVQADHGLKRTE